MHCLRRISLHQYGTNGLPTVQRPSFYIRVSCVPPFERLFRLQLTSSLSTHMLSLAWGYDRNGAQSEHAVCIYPAVDPIENETDLAIEEREMG